MVDPHPSSGSRERGGATRRVKLLVILVAMVALLVAIAMLIVGVRGERLPWRHAQSGDDDGRTARAGVVLEIRAPAASGSR